jgi:hypothetical protein
LSAGRCSQTLTRVRKFDEITTGCEKEETAEHTLPTELRDTVLENLCVEDHGVHIPNREYEFSYDCLPTGEGDGSQGETKDDTTALILFKLEAMRDQSIFKPSYVGERRAHQIVKLFLERNTFHFRDQRFFMRSFLQKPFANYPGCQ